jgi:hypothetical protein
VSFPSRLFLHGVTVAQHQVQFAFASGETCRCLRCGAPCKVDPIPGSKAKWIKAAGHPHGLCINCAVHDHLRHLYPANLDLERSAGTSLLHPQIQRMFFDLAVMHGTDARFEEINWRAIVANWSLPFPTTLKRTATNPVTEQELALARLEGQQRRDGTWKEPLTEEEYETQRQAAIKGFFDCVHGERHEDPPADHRD